MIILYGSYARGDWVRDTYQEGHITHSYQSDLDILIILKRVRPMGHQATSLENRLERKLEPRFQSRSLIEFMDPRPSFIIDSISNINEHLKKGRYFYCDIIKEGILLYDSGQFALVEPKELPWSERKDIAQEDYDYWFGRGVSFLINCHHPLKINDLRTSIFELHQATESFYNTILLVFDGYKPRTHDILELGKYAKVYSDNLCTIFPCATPEQEKCFKLLRAAYIDARYDKYYQISKEQLLYLIERVEKFKALTEEICLKKLNS
jgi:predicted nucleotidyltransferase/HEPN domain-containing protein